METARWSGSPSSTRQRRRRLSRSTPLFPLLGFHSDLGAIKAWGLDTEKADIKVDQLMATNVPGIYAAGDITSYTGKLKLIATGAAEACIAVNNAVHQINPKVKVNPGHSSNMAIFGQKTTEDVRDER